MDSDGCLGLPLRVLRDAALGEAAAGIAGPSAPRVAAQVEGAGADEKDIVAICRDIRHELFQETHATGGSR